MLHGSNLQTDYSWSWDDHKHYIYMSHKYLLIYSVNPVETLLFTISISYMSPSSSSHTWLILHIFYKKMAFIKYSIAYCYLHIRQQLLLKMHYRIACIFVVFFSLQLCKHNFICGWNTRANLNCIFCPENGTESLYIENHRVWFSTVQKRVLFQLHTSTQFHMKTNIGFTYTHRGQCRHRRIQEKFWGCDKFYRIF